MKLKNLFLILFFAVASVGTIAAQDKYDLAVVGYYRDVPDPMLLISINGDTYEQKYVPKEELNGKTWGMSMTPLLKYVNKLQNEGWEVVGGMQVSGLPSQSMFYYSLRKKR